MFSILKNGTSEYQKRMIKTQVRMSDGEIVNGRLGEKILSERQKRQEIGEKYRLKNLE